MSLLSFARHYRHVIQVTGFVAACIAIYSWCTAPVGRLQAEVYYADFELPAPVAQQFTALAPLTEAQTARSEFFRPNLRHRIVPDTSGTVDQILGSVADFVNEKAPGIGHRSDFTFKGFWRIRLHNPGGRAVSNVVVRLPIAASGVVSRPTADQSSVQDLPAATSQLFTIGSIQGADDAAVLYAWTLSPATEDLAKKITVTHDLGSAMITMIR